MEEALAEALTAFQQGEVPVGAVLVSRGEVIAKAHNLCEALQDPTAHAEILAIQRASRTLGSYRLLGAVLYVTVEPCVMCAGASHLARVARVVYGCADPKGGGLGSRYRMHQDGRLNHRLEVQGGVLEEECRRLMQSFFRRLRASRPGSAAPRRGEMAEFG